MNSVQDDGVSSPPGFPIRTSPDQSLFSGSPKLFAAYHVLHRLPMPRHPPYALSSLTIKKFSTKCEIDLLPRKYLQYLRCTSSIILCNCQRTRPKVFYELGGGERVRTDDLLLARQALSQLSYTPEEIWWAREDLNLRPHDYQSCALAS